MGMQADNSYIFLNHRPDYFSSRLFAMIQWSLVSLICGYAEYVHAYEFFYVSNADYLRVMSRPVLGTLAFAASIMLMLIVITPLAAWLTSVEARYRGMRLPKPVVARALDYHTAAYLPVAIFSTLTVVGYRWLIDHNRLDPLTWNATYLYVLCGEVIVGAIYLFNGYWIGMRNVMYANA
jgi:hypothetical protein